MDRKSALGRHMAGEDGGGGAHTSHDPPHPWRLGGGDWSHRLMGGSLQIVREEQPEAGSKYWSFPVVLIYNFPDGYRN